MRIGVTGITSFQFDEQSGQIMFNYGGSLFIATFGEVSLSFLLVACASPLPPLHW